MLTRSVCRRKGLLNSIGSQAVAHDKSLTKSLHRDLFLAVESLRQTAFLQIREVAQQNKTNL